MRLARDTVDGEEDWTMSVPFMASAWKDACMSCLIEFRSLYCLERLLLLDYEERYSTINYIQYNNF